MTTLQSTPPEAALVAIDVAKHRYEVLIEASSGSRRRRMSVLNTRADHDRLVASLRTFDRPVIVGLEPTGNYHRVLAYRLLSAGFQLRLISSMALARTREALHNSWDKNDPKDAQVILHMLRIGATTVYSDPGVSATNGQGKHMNRAIKDATAKRFHSRPTITCAATSATSSALMTSPSVSRPSKASPLRSHPQGMDKGTSALHPRSDPPYAGTKHT